MLRHLTLTIIILIQFTEQDLTQQNDTIIETTTTFKLSVNEKLKAMRTTNITSNFTTLNKPILPPPNKIFHEYLRCRQSSSIHGLPTPNSCPYEFEEDIRVCWKATHNGTYASSIIDYDHGFNNFYHNARYGIENCTLQRFCQNNGTWAMTVSPDLQCKTCIDDRRPVKFNSISIMIETMSLSLSLISLTIAILCMLHVKRLHLPRNLLHMHLFLAFILRSIVKLIFIHIIIGGYTYTMITYTRDKCGNIEILSKSSNLFHVIGCRILSSLFWYTDAVAQTFIFCEAMFLFTALTTHLFRDRGCTLFVLWGWLSPLVWLTMWIASHIVTDKLKQRSTCWLEADHTTYFYYFFYVPYAFYLIINFGIFLFLVRLLYSKYRSNYVSTHRTGNRHLIKSILILIPLFGLHSLFVMWVFYHKNQGHTIWYYIAVIFKAIFGDLQGFFTSLIYFYFNTEIRSEVVQQFHRTLLSNDALRRSSAGDTLSTRLSVFRISLNRRRRSSNQNRSEKSRKTTLCSSPQVLSTRQIYWRKFLVFICPCLFNNNNNKTLEQVNEPQQRLSIKPINYQNETLPIIQINLTSDDNIDDRRSSLLLQKRSSKGIIDNDRPTCDTLIAKNENDNEDLSTDANDVTINQTSFAGEQTSIILNNTSLLTRNDINNHHIRSKSTGCNSNERASTYVDDNKSLR
ncbi:unnamed protein product [Rotaria sordida]|uniref:G-protein coupled receptors family 2 profile 2 domain-containing protein n=1 Tax=Rotaria sordida TaxID=392033 RepID=A0A814CU40_9BILA|nr:unnamed protein product [Rotaria sordida]